MRIASSCWLVVGGIAALAGVALAVGFAHAADAQYASTKIESPGPLTTIWIGQDLSCQAHHIKDGMTGEFYPPSTQPGDCGTFFLDGDSTTGTFYAPDFNTHGGSATGSLGAHQLYTFVSQTPVSGTGDPDDPFKVVTEVQPGPLSGITIVETDEYVIGDEFYTTTVEIQNKDSVDHQFRMWRASDCFLGGSDSGYGYYDAETGDVACTQNANNSPPARIELWHPHTPGSNYYHEFYGTVWSQIGTHGPFPNSCICTTNTDNGAGLEWEGVIAAGNTATFVHDTVFSPEGIIPRPPSASFTYDNSKQSCEDSTVLFTSTSKDSRGIRSLSWTFGDGTNAFGPTIEHQYTEPGTYRVTLTVVNKDGLSSSVTRTVRSVGDPDCCPVLDKVSDYGVYEGQFVHFRLNATDLENDPLSFSLDPTPSSRSTFDTATGDFRWATQRGEAGIYRLKVNALDGMYHLGACKDPSIITIKVYPVDSLQPVIDRDQDGIADQQDNCPSVPNQDQADSDLNGVGNACQVASGTGGGPAGGGTAAAGPTGDADGDGIPDVGDGCPTLADPDQGDRDSDGVGDACDVDLDGDGAVQTGSDPKTKLDNCGLIANPDQLDSDHDGIGDACDAQTLALNRRAGEIGGAQTDAAAADARAQLAEASGNPLRNASAATLAVGATLTVLAAAGLVASVVWWSRRT